MSYAMATQLAPDVLNLRTQGSPYCVLPLPRVSLPRVSLPMLPAVLGSLCPELPCPGLSLPWTPLRRARKFETARGKYLALEWDISMERG